MRSLSEIKQLINTSYSDHLTSNELNWLIEQAEILDKIKKLDEVENMHLSDFGFEVSLIIYQSRISTR